MKASIPSAWRPCRRSGSTSTATMPKVTTQDMVDRADSVFTMGCSIDESCPAVFVPSEDWGLEDPAGR